MKAIFKTVSLMFLLAINAGAQEEQYMYAHYINVGQANAVLLEFPCGAVLIDAGAQDAAYEQKLVDYLDHFFTEREDLNRTLDLVLVTHEHIDHNLALDNVVQEFTVKRYIDNGHTQKNPSRKAPGDKNQVWLQAHAEQLGITYANYSFLEITEDGNRNGITNRTIDPIRCATVDPKIILYSGRFDGTPGWSKTALDNENNHSLVIKVLFGKASFLFLGDLEEKGIDAVVDEYAGTDALDCDVLMVGHHGSYNATTNGLLDAVSPSYAVISCGKWNYGLGPDDPKQFTTYLYGHPRIVTLDSLAAHIPGKRTKPKTVMAAGAAKDFDSVVVQKRIYATPWDKTIRIRASEDGKYKVQTGL